VKERERKRTKERERERDIVFELITAERLTRLYRTLCCTAPVYLLYASRDSITILLYNLKTKRRTNFC